MARQKGMLNLSGNLEPLAGAPLDSRDITPTVADLYVASNWPYKYIGMKTTVTATGDTYRLVNLDVTQESSWVKEGSGESGASNLSDLEDVDLINPEEGEALIYDGEGGWTNGPAGQTYSDFTGATAQATGAHGLVPAPTTGDISKFLKGDGTWATVPMPSFDYSNTSPEAMNFSTDEKVIGTWIDGKPLYQRTYDEGQEITVETSQWYETSHDASNIDKYISASFITGGGNNTYPGLIITATVGGSGNLVLGLQNCLNRSFKFRYTTVRYTKKSDTPVASGEKIVGQWIDGKPVFEKAFRYTSTTINSWVDHDVSSLSIDKIISLAGHATRVFTGFKAYLPFGYYETDGITVYSSMARVKSNNNTLGIRLNTASGESTDEQIAILRYTKTT